MVKREVISLDSGLNVVMEAQNCRYIKVSPFNAKAEELDEEGKLIGLNYSDELKIKAGEVLSFKDDFHKIDFIKKVDAGQVSGYYLYAHDLTKSTRFIMPMLGFDKLYFRWNKNFCNCFIGTESDGDYGNNIYLLYKYDVSAEFKKFERAMGLHPQYDSTIEPDKEHVMFVFNVPDYSVDNLKTILQGKYSYVSDDYKEQVLSFHNIDSESDLGQIMYRGKKRREKLNEELGVEIPLDVDLYEKISPSKEIFLNKYIIHEDEKNKNTRDAQKGDF